MRKLICWLTLLCLLLTPTMNALAEAPEAHTIEKKTLDFYYGDEDIVAQHNVYFIDGSDVPCLALSEYPFVIMEPDLIEDEEDDEPDEDETAGEDTDAAVPSLVFSMEGSVGKLTNPDGYAVTFDCDADTIYFLDYDAFMRSWNGSLLIDVITSSSDVGEDGSVHYLVTSTSSYERYGKEVTINAGDYDIDFIAADGECYVPMQTLSDVLMSNRGMIALYNGEIVVIGESGDLGNYRDGPSELGEKYYSVEPHARSETLARFTYNELCLALDTLYGLKTNHGIESFKDLAEDTGLAEDLAGTDPVKADAALYQLLELHLDDQHTTYGLPSAASGFSAAESFPDDVGSGQSTVRFDQQAKPYHDARAAVYGDDVPVYEEVGNTAYITFDEFNMPVFVDYYNFPLTGEAEEALPTMDTLGRILYAYQKITRKDSPIENVVLDMSNNTGGTARSAAFTIAAFLGMCSLSTRNTLSGALVTGNYMIDLNLDGKIDDGDMVLTKLNRFCLESPVSFSCGNLVPCAFKASNAVALLGRTSGGGSCNVQVLSTADGSSFQISGSLQLSFLKNGSFYDIDQGAEPDFPLMKPESFYDREALTEYINNIR